jgi:TPR repeat protein
MFKFFKFTGKSVAVAFVALAMSGCATGYNQDPYKAAMACESRPNVGACMRAGDYFSELDVKRFRACQSSSDKECLGTGESIGQARRRLNAEAQQHFGKACDLRDADACSKSGIHYAVLYSDQNNSEKEARAFSTQAEAYFRKACDLGSSEGCRNIGSTRF